MLLVPAMFRECLNVWGLLLRYVELVVLNPFVFLRKLSRLTLTR